MLFEEEGDERVGFLRTPKGEMWRGVKGDSSLTVR